MLRSKILKLVERSLPYECPNQELEKLKSF